MGNKAANPNEQLLGKGMSARLEFVQLEMRRRGGGDGEGNDGSNKEEAEET